MGTSPEDIRLFEAWMSWDSELAAARHAVRMAERTGDCTVEMKDAVVWAERGRDRAEAEHDRVAKVPIREIVRASKQ